MPIDPKYELLPESFEKRGKAFTLVCRTDVATLYRCRICDTTLYEVWRRKFNEGGPAKMPGGIVVDFAPKEAFPPDSAFGQWAWTFRDFEKALNKFKEIDPDAVPGLPLLPMGEHR